MFKKIKDWFLSVFRKKEKQKTLTICERDAINQRETEGRMSEIMSQAAFCLSEGRLSELKDIHGSFLRKTRSLSQRENEIIFNTNMVYRQRAVSALSDVFQRLRSSQAEESICGDKTLQPGQRVVINSIKCKGTVVGCEAGFDGRPQYIIEIDDADRKEKNIQDKMGFAYFRGLTLIEGD